MKKTNLVYTTLWIALGVGIMISGNSFAMQWPNLLENESKDWIERSRRQVPIKNFINKDLTTEEKEELKLTLKDYLKKGKWLFWEFQETKIAGEDTTELESQIKDYKMEIFDILDNYVDPDKSEEWTSFKVKMKERIWKGLMNTMKKFKMKNSGMMKQRMDRDDMMKSKMEKPGMMRQKMDRDDMMKNKMMEFQKFIDPNLTDEEKKELKEAMSANKGKLKAVFESMREIKESNWDLTSYYGQIQELMIDGLDIMDDYIDEDKQVEWEEYKAHKKVIIERRVEEKSR